MRTKLHEGRLLKLLDLAQTADRIHMDSCGTCLMGRAYDDKKRFPKMPVPFGGHRHGDGTKAWPEFLGLTHRQYTDLFNGRSYHNIPQAAVIDNLILAIDNPERIRSYEQYDRR
jgi:hypothetical protein